MAGDSGGWAVGHARAGWRGCGTGRGWVVVGSGLAAGKDRR